MGLIEDIGRGPVALDTAIFVYLIERHPDYRPLVRSVIEAIDAGALAAVTSSITLLEVLVVPLRLGDSSLAERYEAALTQGRGLTVVDIERPLLRAAAHLRAAHPSVRTPDALQLAAARASGCSSFLTNDRRLPDLPGIRVLQLDDYLGRRGPARGRRPPTRR